MVFFYRSSDTSTISATATTIQTSHHHNHTHQNQNQNNASGGGGVGHQQQQQHQLQQNQFQTNCSTSASTTTTNSNSSTNNPNNNNNNGSLNNHQRVPFCGLDSIKGSDNNGVGDGVGSIMSSTGCLMAATAGKTNLSFDLNGCNSTSSMTHTHHMVGIGMMLPMDSASSEQFHSLDANDSSCCGDGQFEDDMQALLPKCSRLSRDELSQVSGYSLKEM